MRKVSVSMFVSLDGVVEDPGGSENYRHGGWTFPYWGDDIGEFKREEVFGADGLLLGRVTYEGFAAAWPGQTDEAGFADRFNSMPKYVASTTLSELEWNNSHLLEGDAADAVARLKAEDGQELMINGSVHLIRSLMERGLIDEYRLLVYPIVLGSGLRLFGESAEPTRLELVDSKPFSSGAVLLTYRGAS
jgi:dihydrofolate reductase